MAPKIADSALVCPHKAKPDQIRETGRDCSMLGRDELANSRVFRGRCNSEPAVTVRDPCAVGLWADRKRLMW